jgi:mercuric reductase
MGACCSKGRCAGGGVETRPDVLVVGTGSAGFSAAITAAESGARVVLLGEGTIGGTCVNVGCVPSKALIRAMQAVEEGRRAVRFAGVMGGCAVSDWAALVRQKQALVEGLRRAKYEDVLPEYPNVSYVPGRARFTGDGAEMEANGVRYRAGKVILTTGSSPSTPAIPGMEGVAALDSTKALEMERLPGSLLILGGGVIAVELGQMFARAGVKVTICCRSRILPKEEPEVSQALAGYLREEGVAVREGLEYIGIEKGAEGVRLSCRVGGREERIEGEQVLAATGRKPNTEGLGAELAGVRLDEKGAVVVNEYMQTSHPDVYAAGDVTGRDLFVYMAAYGAKVAARNAMEGNRQRYDNEVMPEVVFTDPQVASVGLTEKEARERGRSVETRVLALDAVPRYLAGRDARGMIKLVGERDSGRLLGGTVLAREGGEAIQTLGMALRAGLTAEELGGVIFPYLTGVEGLKLAAQTFTRDVNRLSCCAG